jgi:hypothetical protein
MIRDYYSDETISNETLYANCDRLTWTVDILFDCVYLEDLQRNRVGGTFDWLTTMFYWIGRSARS